MVKNSLPRSRVQGKRSKSTRNSCLSKLKDSDVQQRSVFNESQGRVIRVGKKEAGSHREEGEMDTIALKKKKKNKGGEKERARLEISLGDIIHRRQNGPMQKGTYVEKMREYAELRREEQQGNGGIGITLILFLRSKKENRAAYQSARRGPPVTQNRPKNASCSITRGKN